MQNRGRSPKDNLTDDNLKKLLKDPVVEELEQFEKTRGKLRLPADIKPCITRLLDGASPRVKDGNNAFIVACELYRVGRTKSQIESALTRLEVKQSKVRAAAKSAATGKYNYGCPSLEQLGLCLCDHRSQCWWYEEIPRVNRTNLWEPDFWRFAWPQELTSSEGMVYQAIREIERRKRVPAGSLLVIPYKLLSEVSGVSQGWISKCCQELHHKGLIKFKKGRRHKWYGQASRLRRIRPIPRPK